MELLFYESSLQLAATIVRPIIKSTDHKESDLCGFSLLSPLTVLWQYIHPSFSTKRKLNSPSHKSVPGSCTKRIENPNSLFLVFLDNPRLSKHKVVPFKAPTNVGTPSHSNKSHNIPKNPTFHFAHPTYCLRGCSWNTFRSSSSSLIDPYSMHLLSESYGTKKIQSSILESPTNVWAFVPHTKTWKSNPSKLSKQLSKKMLYSTKTNAWPL